MNNGGLWLVVQPTVGIPILLGAVAVGSFAVHVSVLTNTGWVDDFLAGREMGSTAAAASAPVSTAEAEGKVYFESASLSSIKSGQIGTIVLPDGRTADIILKPEAQVVSALATRAERAPGP